MDDPARLIEDAVARLQAGRPAEAAEILERALAAEPDNASAHANLAAAFLGVRARTKAAEHARRATELDPALTEAHVNLGNALFGLGDAEGAAAAFARAVETAPENDPARETAWTNYLFALNFAPDAGAERIFAENRRWGREIEARIGAIERPAPPPADRLRLAYYLPEMNTHVTARFLEPLLACHDHTAFEVLGYGDRTDGKPPPEAFAAAFDAWTDTKGLGAAEVAARMRADGVHVLAHPCTFKARYREVLAHRAAPFQAACLNLVSTTGLEACDALVTDAVLDPPEETERFYTETLVRLSGFNVYRLPPDVPLAPPPALAAGHVTFGSFNNVAKLTPEAVAAWAAILDAVPESRLLLKHRAFDDDSVAARVRGDFEALGVAGARLGFDGFTADVAEYLTHYNRVDVALDPFPFGGGTTSYEALWMGVPIVTLEGETFMGRLTADLAARAGRGDLVTRDAAGYLAVATALAADPTALADARPALREAARATIFDARAFTAEFEIALVGAWQAMH